MDSQRIAAARPRRPKDEPLADDQAPIAIEWLVDAAGCDPQLLSNLEHLKRTCDAIVEALDLHVIGEPRWHHFPNRRDSSEPGGATGLYLLAESHLTCHTFPEDRLAAFNLYCCRGRAPWDWSGFLRERLRANEVVVRTITRGGPAATQLPAVTELTVAQSAGTRSGGGPS